jgi:CBS domain-containing protein
LRCAILCVRLHGYPAEEVLMRIADVMTRDLPTVEPGTPVREAARQMRERGVRALPVCEGERLVGIVTDWDLARALADEGDPAGRPLGDFMSTDLVAAAPDATFAEAAELMADRRVHHLLVRDGENLAGMLHLDVEWSELSGAVGSPVATFAAKI